MAKLIDNTRPSKPQPSINLTEDELPEIKSWKVGSKYSIILEVEMTRQSKGDIFLSEGERKYEGSFKILSATTEGGSKDEDKEMEAKGERYPENKMKMMVMKEKMKKMDEENPKEEKANDEEAD